MYRKYLESSKKLATVLDLERATSILGEPEIGMKVTSAIQS